MRPAIAKTLIAVAISLLLLGCGRATPPLEIPSPVPAGDELGRPAMPASSTAPTSPRPAATRLPPTPSPTPCAHAVLPALKPAYLDIELGCPLNAGLTPIATAYAPFEGGQMLWRQDNAVIYVLTNDGRWAQYDDLWREGDAEFTCGEPNNPPTPVRGFGRIWCDQPAVRQALGAATAAEIGDAGGRAQDFANGMLLASPDGSTFVLVGESATWRRVWPND